MAKYLIKKGLTKNWKREVLQHVSKIGHSLKPISVDPSLHSISKRVSKISHSSFPFEWSKMKSGPKLLLHHK